MICRYKVFYLFLLTVPFFNILGLKFGNTIVIAFILFYVFLTLLIFRQQRIRAQWVPALILLYACVMCLSMSEAHSVLNLGRSNISSIRFFGLFVPVLIFYIFHYNPKIFIEKYLDKILSFYVLVFSCSIMIDYVILHSGLDVSLQPMYRIEDWNYFSRPFGITGQPSVNAVLLVVFYTLLLSRTSLNKSKTLFLFMVIGVGLQGSGSGYIALMMLFYVMLERFHWRVRVFFSCCSLLLMAQLDQEFKFLDKVSIQYITDVTQVFMVQIDDWIIQVSQSYPLLSVLLGGVSSEIDFGPLYFMSNVGLIYSILFLMLIGIAVVKAKNRYQRVAIFILLVGNLHYPVMFYATTVFFLPLLLQLIIFPAKDHAKFSGVGIA